MQRQNKDLEIQKNQNQENTVNVQVPLIQILQKLVNLQRFF